MVGRPSSYLSARAIPILYYNAYFYRRTYITTGAYNIPRYNRDCNMLISPRTRAYGVSHVSLATDFTIFVVLGSWSAVDEAGVRGGETHRFRGETNESNYNIRTGALVPALPRTRSKRVRC